MLYRARLLEVRRLQALLLEGRMDFLRTTYLPKLALAWQSGVLRVPAALTSRLQLPPGQGMSSRPRQKPDAERFASTLFDYVAGCDPDVTKKHTQWLLTLILRKTNPMPLEDLEHAGETIGTFMAMKQARELGTANPDINSYKSLSDLSAALRGEQDQSSHALASQEQAMLAQCTVIYDGADYRVLSLLTKQAACYFGCDTEWCTAWGAPGCRHPTRTNQFDSYISQGPLYYILDKRSQQRWQFSFGAEQYMDVDDRSIHLARWLDEHPKINQIFERLDGEPIAEINSLPVYAQGNGAQGKGAQGKGAQGNGFMVKTQRGPLGQALLTVTTDAAGVLTAMTGRWLSNFRQQTDRHGRGNVKNDNLPDKIAALLMHLKITGDPQGEAVFDLYYRNRRWGTVDHCAKPLYRFGATDLFGPMTEWRQVRTPTLRDLVLMGQNGVIYLHAEVEDGVFTITQASNDAYTKQVEGDADQANLSYAQRRALQSALIRLNPMVSHAITELLLKLNIVKKWQPDSAVKPEELAPEDKARLLQAKPRLGSIPSAYQMHGNSPVVKSMIIDWCKDNDLTRGHYADAGKGDWLGDRLVIERFKNADDLIEEIGNDGAKWFAKVLSGGHYLDMSGGETDRTMQRDMIEDLPPETLHALGRYLQRHYPDEADEIDEYDPADTQSVVELADMADDDALDSAVSIAASAGQERGAENEMAKMFWSAIESNDCVIFLDKRGKPTKPAYDTVCVLAIPLSKIVDAIADDDDPASAIDQEGWAEVFDARINLEEPHYGFSDYDADAARERFAEAVDELVAAGTTTAD